MHELTVANSVLDTVRAEMRRRPGARAVKVSLRVGEMAGLDPEALRFGFEVLVRGTDLEPLELEIEPVLRRHRCPRCREEFTVVDFSIICPVCGEVNTRAISGDELEVAYLEVEEV